VLATDNRGQVLFGRYCDSCHPGGREGKGIDLLSPELRRDFQTESQVIQLVRDGTCKMPKFDRFLLADADLGEIAKFTLDRAKAAVSASPSSPLPPLDGQGIFQNKCVVCHNSIDVPIDPRDVQVLFALDQMGKCAGLTAEQKTALGAFIRSQQVRSPSSPE
jgi:mono/diheme cytochrome c family protein